MTTRSTWCYLAVLVAACGAPEVLITVVAPAEIEPALRELVASSS